MKAKIEIGVVRDDATTWPFDYRTWAIDDEIAEALSWLIGMASRNKDKIAGFRLTNEA